MADEEHRIRVTVEGEASTELDKIAGSSEKAEKSTAKLNKGTKKQSGLMKELDGALGLANLGYLAVFAGVVKVVGAMFDAAKQYATQQSSLGRLSRSLRKAGADYQDLSRISDLTRSASNSLGIELVDTQQAMQVLVEATGDVSKAEADFKLALDVSAASGEELTTVTKDLAEARKGEFEGLKKYAGFNKQFIEDLVAQADAGEAAAEAIDKLETSYDGAGVGLRGLDDEMKSFTTRAENMETSIGGILANMTELAAFNFKGGLVGKVFAAYEQGFGELEKITSAAVEATKTRDPQAMSELAALATSLKAGNVELNVALQHMEAIMGRAGDRAAAGPGTAPAAVDTFVGPAMPDENEMLKKRQALYKLKLKEREEAEAAARARAEERKLINQDIELREKGIEILEASGEKSRRILEYERELLEISFQKLTPQQEALAQKEAELKLNQDLADIERERQEAFTTGVVQQQQDYYDQLKKDQQDTLALQEALAKQEKKREQDLAAMQQRTAEANKEKVDAMFAGAQGAADVADVFIENERAMAGIRGAIAAAESVAAFAGGNVAGGIGFAAAAVQFFAVAGGAGAPSGGGGGAGGGSRRPSFEERAGATQVGTGTQAGGNTTVQLTFSSAVPATPQIARQLVDTVNDELRNRSAAFGVR